MALSLIFMAGLIQPVPNSVYSHTDHELSKGFNIEHVPSS